MLLDNTPTHSVNQATNVLNDLAKALRLTGENAENLDLQIHVDHFIDDFDDSPWPYLHTSKMTTLTESDFYADIPGLWYSQRITPIALLHVLVDVVMDFYNKSL